MKKRTKIQSTLAVAVLCSLMNSAYAEEVPVYRAQADLTITGNQTTISDDSFPKITNDPSGLGKIPLMHYVGQDNVFVKNADGTYSNYGTSHSVHTNGRVLLSDQVIDMNKNKDGSTDLKKYWTTENNTLVALKQPNTLDVLKDTQLPPFLGGGLSVTSLYAKSFSVTVLENGAERTIKLPWATAIAQGQLGYYLHEAVKGKKNDLTSITLQDFKNAIQNYLNNTSAFTGNPDASFTDNCGFTYTKADLEALRDNIIGLEIEFDGLNANKTTTTNTSEDLMYSYKGVNVTAGSEWAPMDYSEPIKIAMEVPDNIAKMETGTYKYDENGFAGGQIYEYEAGEMATAFGIDLKHQYVTVKNLNTEENATVNMSLVNTIGDNPRVHTIDDPERLRRFLYVDDANLANNTTFKVGIYGYAGEENGLKTGGVADMIMLRNINNEGTADAEKETINIALGYVPELKDLTARTGEVILHKGGNGTAAKATWVLAYSSLEDIEKVNVVGVASEADGIFDSYTITPVVNNSYGSGDSTNSMGIRVESYTYEQSGVSENVKALADFHVTGDKVVRLQQDSFFRNAGGRELIDRHTGDNKRDNEVWADYWHGKVSSSSTYGRKISQSYNGYQVGYDTLMVPDYKNGNIYVGAYLSKIDSDSTVASGKGELDSVGFGLYGTWVGNRGHYIDGVISVNDLDNEFNYNTELDGKVTGDYSHRYYTAAAQYGYRKHYDKGFFVEPKLSMSIGYGEGTDYQLTNGINAKMDDYKNIIGKVGAYVGKEFGNKGNVYVGAFYAHNYAKDMKGVLSYDSNGKTATKDLDVVDLEDTWYEFNIGAKYALSSNSNIAVDYIKQTGSDIGNDWSLNCTYQFMF